jgi:hypothetical protein
LKNKEITPGEAALEKICSCPRGFGSRGQRHHVVHRRLRVRDSNRLSAAGCFTFSSSGITRDHLGTARKVLQIFKK